MKIIKIKMVRYNLDTKKSFGPDFLMYVLEGEPQTFKEAVNSIEGLMWKEAIKSEIDSILHNHTWELVVLPLGCKPKFQVGVQAEKESRWIN